MTRWAGREVTRSEEDRAKSRAYARAWRLLNAAAWRAYRRKWHAANRERINAARREKYAASKA